jgi:hypothetical protein
VSRVELLPFPPPFRSGLALSNDLDHLWEPRSWYGFLRFLNTREETALGPGLGLEVGDSFWFYSDHADEQPAAYFEGLSSRPSPFAPYIGTLGRAGYLDTLHSYGNFSRHGGFRREHAVQAARALEDEGFAPRAWVNHGGAHDFQNLVSGCGDLPENPEARGAPAPEYHLDLTWTLGFRYAWLGDLTRVPGQERKLGLGDWLDPGSPLRREAMGWVGRGLSRRLGYRKTLDALPNYAVLENRLLAPRQLRDRTVVQSFVRYGDFQRATFAHLSWLLRREFLDALERWGGMSVAFVHWGKHPGRVFDRLDPEGMRSLAELARRFHEGRIWVTTTTRLLAYAEAHRAVRFRTEETEGGLRIVLDADPLPDGRSLDVEGLSALSFRVPDPGRTEITWQGKPVPSEAVPGEPGMVWIPWTRLQFPDPPSGEGS